MLLHSAFVGQKPSSHIIRMGCTTRNIRSSRPQTTGRRGGWSAILEGFLLCGSPFFKIVHFLSPSPYHVLRAPKDLDTRTSAPEPLQHFCLLLIYIGQSPSSMRDTLQEPPWMLKLWVAPNPIDTGLFPYICTPMTEFNL